jgi:tripartite-type tricarboxylate transporter receptor subunit TctC
MTIARHRLALGAGLAAALFGLVQSAPSAAADASLKGKTIRFVVGFGVGGGYDVYSRMLAPYFEKRLGATIVVENQPGAGGMVALNHMYVAPQGVEMTIVNGTGAALQQLLGVKGVRFDLTKFGNLGIIDSSRWIWLVQPKSTIKTVEDAQKFPRPITWGGSGKIAGTSDGAAFTCHMLHFKCKIVTGYKGSHASAMALATGEMDALYVSETSAYNYVQAKNAKPIATVNRERSILFPDLPTITELVKLDKDQQWWLDYRNTLEGLGRILVVPPNTPHATLALLQQAAKDILTDKKIVADANKKKRYINYLPPAKTKEMIERILHSVTPEQKKAIYDVVLGS